MPNPLRSVSLPQPLRSVFKPGQWAGISSLVAIASLLPISSAAALSTTAIGEKLGGIPVFTLGIIREDGNVSFLEEAVQDGNGQSVDVIRIYLDPEDAQADLALMQQETPAVPDTLSVATVSLGEVFCLEQQENPCEQLPAQPEAPPEFIYFPDSDQLSQAVDVLTAQGVELSDPPPLFIPLFFAQIEQPTGEQQISPTFYFSINDLRQDLTTAQESDPELADVTLTVGVTTLNRVLDQLLSQDDEFTSNFQFVPLLPSAPAPAAEE